MTNFAIIVPGTDNAHRVLEHLRAQPASAVFAPDVHVEPADPYDDRELGYIQLEVATAEQAVELVEEAERLLGGERLALVEERWEDTGDAESGPHPSVSWMPVARSAEERCDDCGAGGAVAHGEARRCARCAAEVDVDVNEAEWAPNE